MSPNSRVLCAVALASSAALAGDGPVPLRYSVLAADHVVLAKVEGVVTTKPDYGGRLVVVSVLERLAGPVDTREFVYEVPHAKSYHRGTAEAVGDVSLVCLKEKRPGAAYYRTGGVQSYGNARYAAVCSNGWGRVRLVSGPELEVAFDVDGDGRRHTVPTSGVRTWAELSRRVRGAMAENDELSKRLKGIRLVERQVPWQPVRGSWSPHVSVDGYESGAALTRRQVEGSGWVQRDEDERRVLEALFEAGRLDDAERLIFATVVPSSERRSLQLGRFWDLAERLAMQLARMGEFIRAGSVKDCVGAWLPAVVIDVVIDVERGLKLAAEQSAYCRRVTQYGWTDDFDEAYARIRLMLFDGRTSEAIVHLQSEMLAWPLQRFHPDRGNASILAAAKLATLVPFGAWSKRDRQIHSIVVRRTLGDTVDSDDVDASPAGMVESLCRRATDELLEPSLPPILCEWVRHEVLKGEPSPQRTREVAAILELEADAVETWERRRPRQSVTVGPIERTARQLRDEARDVWADLAREPRNLSLVTQVSGRTRPNERR